MRKVGLTAAVLATLALTLSGCGKESTANNTANNESLIEAPVQEAAASGAFGTAVKSADGITSEVTNPTTFKPGQFASGQLQVTQIMLLTLNSQTTVNLRWICHL